MFFLMIAIMKCWKASSLFNVKGKICVIFEKN